MDSRLLPIVIRFLHIASISTLVGCSVFGGLIGQGFSNEAAARWRPIITSAVIVAFFSGLYQIMTKLATPEGYHMWFGIKVLLALHVMAVSIIAGRSSTPVAKRQRLLTGSAITGLIIVAISAKLRG